MLPQPVRSPMERLAPPHLPEVWEARPRRADLVLAELAVAR